MKITKLKVDDLINKNFPTEMLEPRVSYNIRELMIVANELDEYVSC